MVCCDTNFLIELLRNTPQAISKLAELGDESLTTTIISVAELCKGVYRTNDISRSMADVWSLLSNFIVLNLDRAGCLTYGELSASLTGNQLADADMLIASIAISNSESLLTSDSAFERVPNLETDNWI